MRTPTEVNQRCSIARSLTVLGEKWALLVVRDVALGHRRFTDLRTRLGVAPDILTSRLETLVDAGVLERRSYQETGARERQDYHLTAAGEELLPVLAALSAWGDVHAATAFGPAVRYVDRESGRPVRLAFVDDQGAPVDASRVGAVLGPGAV